ncbi:MAG: hypothetical protein GX975_01070 [Clostridiales bacterium]|nr:hypothetical protein [Clostridiales bacterium]
MRKIVLRILLIFLLLINLLPLWALAASDTPPPEKPYEKVVAKHGSWYTEQLSYEGKSNLVIGYKGDWEGDASSVMEAKIKEEIVLTGVYVPALQTWSDGIYLSITDSSGKTYSNFSLEKYAVGAIKETGALGSYSAPSDGRGLLVFTPEDDIKLPAGDYTLRVEGSRGLVGAYLLKGILAGAYEKYMEALNEWELKNNPRKGDSDHSFGSQTFVNEEGELVIGEPQPDKQAIFGLDAEYKIEEIIVSTYNGGQGAEPGTIAVIDDYGRICYHGQAEGVTLEDIPNSSWKVNPGIVLPAGYYMISLSQPELLDYDENGEPLFFVKATVPLAVRPDFTGTYKINLDTFKISTLMGPVTGNQGSSFSLKDFELTVLDKDGEFELIGKYEGVAFSQICKVTEETAEYAVAEFTFAVDLQNLPYKAKVSAEGRITFSVSADGTPQIDMAGRAVYDRAASAEKGADYNTYSIEARGPMAKRELPPFVMTALGKAKNAGNIPGPDNVTQAAAGMLFPPLAGLIVNVLQELLKPKERPKPRTSARPKIRGKGGSGEVRDKAWYKKQYPGRTDEQIAMIMMADAMGNTDEPDLDDAISVGDNERVAGASESSGGGVLGGDEEWGYEAEDYSSEYEPADEPYREPESYQPASETGVPETGAAQTEPEVPEIPAEPETMVLRTSAYGAESMYVKDPVTGEWVNSETGAILDLDRYEESIRQMDENRAWKEEREREIAARGGSEYEKELRENMRKIREKEQQTFKENALRTKYGLDDLKQIRKIMEDEQAEAAAWANTWHRNGNLFAAAEYTAVGVDVVTGVAVDGMAKVVPGGTAVRGGYKLLKGVSSTMSDAFANKKDVFTLANLAEGAIKGGADALTDIVPGGPGFAGKALEATGKATVTVYGETLGSAAGAYLRGESTSEALVKGFKEGSYKAAVGFVTDQLAGELPDAAIGDVTRSNVKSYMKNVVVSRTTGVKLASAYTDEYALKPAIFGDN